MLRKLFFDQFISYSTHQSNPLSHNDLFPNNFHLLSLIVISPIYTLKSSKSSPYVSLSSAKLVDSRKKKFPFNANKSNDDNPHTNLKKVLNLSDTRSCRQEKPSSDSLEGSPKIMAIKKEKKNTIRPHIKRDILRETRAKHAFVLRTKGDKNHEKLRVPLKKISPEFHKLNLIGGLLRRIDSMGWTKPTRVQEETIKMALRGFNIVASAKTGTGKTAAYALPILQRLYIRKKYEISRGINRVAAPLALILCPTTELCEQVEEQIYSYAQNLNDFRIIGVSGANHDIKAQMKALSDGVDILVATPGRLLSIIGETVTDNDKIDDFKRLKQIKPELHNHEFSDSDELYDEDIEYDDENFCEPRALEYENLYEIWDREENECQKLLEGSSVSPKNIKTSDDPIYSSHQEIQSKKHLSNFSTKNKCDITHSGEADIFINDKKLNRDISEIKHKKDDFSEEFISNSRINDDNNDDDEKFINKCNISKINSLKSKTLKPEFQISKIYPLNLTKVRFLALDEVDRMLSMGMFPEVRHIFSKLPRVQRKNEQDRMQVYMFTATLVDKVKSLVRRFAPYHLKFDLNMDMNFPLNFKQFFYKVGSRRKFSLLTYLLRRKGPLRTSQILIFCRTHQRTERLEEQLQKVNLKATCIHGQQSLTLRQHNLDLFKSKKVQILVATDVMSRGIDIIDLPYVVNYDLPHNPEDYIHRVGRTARAGNQGVAISFLGSDPTVIEFGRHIVSLDENDFLEKIKKFTKLNLNVSKVPGPWKDEPKNRKSTQKIHSQNQQVQENIDHDFIEDDLLENSINYDEVEDFSDLDTDELNSRKVLKNDLEKRTKEALKHWKLKKVRQIKHINKKNKGALRDTIDETEVLKKDRVALRDFEQGRYEDFLEESERKRAIRSGLHVPKNWKEISSQKKQKALEKIERKITSRIVNRCKENQVRSKRMN